MKINVKKSELILMIMDYLKSENLDKTLVSLENESGVQLYEYNREISFLRHLILEGHWTDAEEFLKPLKEHPNFEYNSSIFEIRKQKFLEAVEEEPESKSNNVEDLVNLLKELQSRCSVTVFNELMFCLSSPSITNHSEYKNWTPLSGRLKCFSKLRDYLEIIYPVNREEIKIQSGTFNKLLKNLVLGKFQSLNKNNLTSVNVSILDENFTQESYENKNMFFVNFEDDVKNKMKKTKDDNELLKKSNSALKVIRNEKISQSLKVNKISEIEDEDYSKRSNNNINNINNLGQLQIGQNNLTSQDKNYERENEKNSTKNNSKNFNTKSNEYSKTKNSKTKNSQNQNNQINPNTQIYSNNSNTNSIQDANLYDFEHTYKSQKSEDEIIEEDIEHLELEEDNNLNQNDQINQLNQFNQFNQHEEANAKYLKYKDNELLISTCTVNKNNLSDLDKEEYYMKSQYDYYDYHIETLSERKVIQDSHPIRTSCFSPRGDYFALGTNSKSIKLFNMKPILNKIGKKNQSQNFTNSIEDVRMIFEQKNHHLGSIYCLDWSISGRLIASGSNDKLVKLMVIPDLEESYAMKEQETLELTISGHRGTIRSVSFEPTSDLVLLSAGTVDSTVKVWDAEKGTNITNLEGHSGDVNTIKWSNDALICASSGADKTIRFWDLRDYKTTFLISALKYADINDISIFTKNKSVSNTLVAAGHMDGTITIWDYHKKSVIKEIHEHTQEVRSVSFSPDGRYLVSASFDSTIKIFDVENKFEIVNELEHNDRVVSVKWHPDVPLLVSTSADKTARIWMPES